MDFVEAVEFSKKFLTSHPKVFKGFVEWGVWDTGTEGYVVLTDSDVYEEPCSNQLEDYIKCRKLRIDHGKDYPMISTPQSDTSNCTGFFTTHRTDATYESSQNSSEREK
jgi:hypothetical protein